MEGRDVLIKTQCCARICLFFFLRTSLEKMDFAFRMEDTMYAVELACKH
jgi:hypothetical protein